MDDLLIKFIVASFFLALAPGPDNLFVVALSISNGRKAGFMCTLGLATGIIGHTILASLGVSVIFKSSLLAFNLLKTAGIIYLLYLAWLSFNEKNDSEAGRPLQSGDFLQWYRRGILMNLLNPKVAIFFLAFFPQFIDSQAQSVVEAMFLRGLLFMMVTIVVFGAMAVFAGYLNRYLSKIGPWLGYAKALFFTLLAALLFFSRQ